MEGEFIRLGKGDLEVCLAMPGTYYRGTRFDWNAVFRSVGRGGIMYADRWFDSDDALRHDNVCGPSEEFSPVWADETHCVKPGVGLLEVAEGREAYDRFRLYPILDGGSFEVAVMGEGCEGADGDTAVFTHRLEGWYTYEKTVRLEDGGRFSIRHSLRWESPEGASMDCYNHNFFTMGMNRVGPSRVIEFDAPVHGDWRSDSVSGLKDEALLRFARPMQNGEKCFIGNLTVPRLADAPYHFRVCEGGISEAGSDAKSGISGAVADIRCDAPMDHAVFWSNHRVACVEPYVNIALPAGQTFGWTIHYALK